jgi:hypothetical protein
LILPTLPELFLRADREDFAFFYRHGCGDVFGGVQGDDLSTTIDSLGSRGEGCASAEEKREEMSY